MRLRRAARIHSARCPVRARLVLVCLNTLECHHSVNRNASATANVLVTWLVSAKNVKIRVLERVARTPNAEWSVIHRSACVRLATQGILSWAVLRNSSVSVFQYFTVMRRLLFIAHWLTGDMLSNCSRLRANANFAVHTIALRYERSV